MMGTTRFGMSRTTFSHRSLSPFWNERIVATRLRTNSAANRTVAACNRRRAGHTSGTLDNCNAVLLVLTAEFDQRAGAEPVVSRTVPTGGACRCPFRLGQAGGMTEPDRIAEADKHAT